MRSGRWEAGRRRRPWRPARDDDAATHAPALDVADRGDPRSSSAVAATQAERHRAGQPVVRRGDRRRRPRPPVRHRPLADPGRGDVPALRLVPRVQPDRRAVDDVPHPGRRAPTASARRCSSSGCPAWPRSSSSNFTFGPHDVMIVFSAGGTTAVPVEMARGARRARPARHRGHLRRAVDVGGARPDASAAGSSTRPTSSSTCAPRRPTRSSTSTASTRPVGPGSTDRRRRHRQLHQGADAPSSSPSEAPCHRSSPGHRSSAPSAPGRCSTQPIESMRGGSPAPSTSEEVGDGTRRAGRDPAIDGPAPTTHAGDVGGRSQGGVAHDMKSIAAWPAVARGHRRVAAVVPAACSAAPAPRPARAGGAAAEVHDRVRERRRRRQRLARGDALLGQGPGRQGRQRLKVTIIHHDTDAAGQLADIRT